MKLFHRKYGSGPPLVILHGLYGSSDNWVSVAGKLSDTFTVILPDLRNHGQSPHSQTHNYEEMANDVAELINDCGYDRIFLAGHSMGGKVAIKFASVWPEKLNGLIILDISPFGTGNTDNPFYKEHRTILEAISGVKPGDFTKREEIDLYLSGSISSEKTRSFIMKNIKRDADGKLGWKLNIPTLLANLGEITGGVIERGNPGIRITGFPVIFVKGEQSGYLTETDRPGIEYHFPAAEFITIPGAGHWIHSDNPALTESAIRSILN